MICNRCVMDESDPDIIFYELGCSNCKKAIRDLENWEKNNFDSSEFKSIINKKIGGKKSKPILIGLSGGVDSCYTLHALVGAGFDVTAIHIDAGWNSKIANSNIFKITNSLNINLKTIVIPWEPIRLLQIAYLSAGVLNLDIPQDHLFTIQTKLYASKYGFNLIASGWNFSSESILPKSWAYSARDGRQIKYIAKHFGLKNDEIKKLNIETKTTQIYKYNIKNKIRIINPLNHVDYNRDVAKKILVEKYNWEDYGGKHEESRWTKFYQGYVLPARWGIDKRKAHLSSQIVAGQISRESALEILSKPVFSEQEILVEIGFIASKLQISVEELVQFMNLPKTLHDDLPGDHVFRKIKNWMQIN